MLHLIKRKIQNKKVLNGCLLLGILLLVAIATSTPMFKKGSLDRLIQSKFEEYIKVNNTFPVVLGREASVKEEEGVDYSEGYQEIKGFVDNLEKSIEIPIENEQIHMWLNGSRGTRQYGSEINWIRVGCIAGMEEHIELEKGDSFSNTKFELAKGAYPCYMTENVMDSEGFVYGEQICFSDIKKKDGSQLVLQIVGIIDEKSHSDSFWNTSLQEISKELLVNEETFAQIITDLNTNELYYTEYVMLDYSEIQSENVDGLKYSLKKLHDRDEYFTENVSDMIEEYKDDKQFINTIFWVLELPIFVLLLAFIYMVSSQILSMESGEISMFKSRGFSVKQIVGIYLRQSVVLVLSGIVLGLPFGILLCKMAASANGFLEFSFKSTSIYKPVWEMIPYAIGTGVIVICFMTLPVIFYSRDTIVEQKSKLANLTGKTVAEKYYVDVVLLLISGYLLYNYSKQKSLLAWDVLTGEKMDPMVFLNLSLFLFGCGLLGIRLIKYLVGMIYHLRKNAWKPHMYASFLQIMRTGGKRNFISVFLIFTISMGIVNANVAGSINENNKMRTVYNLGADVVIAEHWNSKKYMDSVERKVVQYYEEPDYGRYDELLTDTCTNMTRVVKEDGVDVYCSGKTISGCSTMAIHTKEFGETASLRDGLNEEHWYEYLNALAKNSTGVLISENLAKVLGIKEGDSLQYSRKDPLEGKSESATVTCSSVVCGIFDAWPGYEQYSYDKNEKGDLEEKENYLVVSNYAYEVSVMGEIPYEIWCKTNKTGAGNAVRKFLSEQNISTDYVYSVEEEVTKIRDSAMIQITNGLFSLSFLVSVILCTIGFLIYWITSIKQRELLFGIYRAMGMRMKEIGKMLINEQIFSSLLAGVFGGCTGLLATRLFTDLLATVYLPKKHNIPFQTVFDAKDMIRLGIVVLFIIGVVLFVLRNILKKSSITSAIKMGED